MAEKPKQGDIRNFLPPLKKMKEEDEQGQGKESQSLKNEHHGHYFRFRYKTEKPNVVNCTPSMTLLEALINNSAFGSLQNRNSEKELVIQREKEPRAAVNAHFPCCLIARNELLHITFIKSSQKSSSKKKPGITCRSLMGSPEKFCIFYIKTTGGKKINQLMKNPELKRAVETGVDYVCIYAIRGEKLIHALKRDGRFIPEVFQKHCALSDLESGDTHNMSNTVDPLHGKKFQVIVLDDGPASQELSPESYTVKNKESVDASAISPRPESSTSTDQESADAQQQKPQPTVNERKSTEHPKKNPVKEIPNTGEILKLLRGQFEGLLKQLKVREGLTKPSEVQTFFREEYDKSAQSFSEVKRVKQLMELSNSVCQIRVEGSPIGTGFLLFNRFILTNAHVVGNYNPFTHKLQQPITAVFDYEDLDMGKKLPVKESVVALYHGKNEKGQNLDFALLELDDKKPPNCQELLSFYSPPPIRGGICIIGHPDGGVKRMDPCFIIESDDILKAEYEHLLENREFLHVITQTCLAGKWERNFTQINYDSCFFHGSSGSPVFNDACKLIGVHTGGYCYKQGQKTRSVTEYALPMLPILECIISQCWQTGRADIAKRIEKHLGNGQVIH